MFEYLSRVNRSKLISPYLREVTDGFVLLSSGDGLTSDHIRKCPKTEQISPPHPLNSFWLQNLDSIPESSEPFHNISRGNHGYALIGSDKLA